MLLVIVPFYFDLPLTLTCMFTKLVLPMVFYRNAIRAFAVCFTFEHEFLEHIMKGLYQCYSHWIGKKKRGWMNALSGKGTELGAIEEVCNYCCCLFFCVYFIVVKACIYIGVLLIFT